MIERHPKLLLIAALVLCVPLSWGAGFLNDYYLNVLINVGINITLAVSLNLINGYTGQFSLGHAGFMAVGGYTAATITLKLGASFPGPVPTTLLFVTALVLGGLAAAFAGLVVGVPSLRLRGDYLALATLGFGEIIRVLLQNTDTMANGLREWATNAEGGMQGLRSWFNGNGLFQGLLQALETMGGASGMKGIPPLTNLFWTLFVAVITIYVILTLVHSTYGRGFLAVHDDEIAASAMGLNPTRYKVTAFIIGAFFAGIAGGLYGHYTQFLSPTGFDFMKSIEIVLIVILGGMGNTAGVVIAAIVLTLLTEFLRKYVGEYRMIFYALLIIGLMMLRPQGLFTFHSKQKATT